MKKKQAREEQGQNEVSKQRVNYGLAKEQAGIHATPIQMQDKSTNVGVLNKRAISEDLSDEYRVTHSEDDMDPDKLEETQDEDEETSAHLHKAFGSTANSDCQEEIQCNY